jgi:NAD(P)-dependent dehydrogenase (short-subunit alcohol dehydrogenase family)
MNTNLKSMFLTCRAVLPQMLRQEKGSILNFSSTAAIRTWNPHFVYSLSKAGVNQLTRVLAVRYADKGIMSNAIMPGLMDTPMVDQFKSIYGGMRKE